MEMSDLNQTLLPSMPADPEAGMSVSHNVVLSSVPYFTPNSFRDDSALKEEFNLNSSVFSAPAWAGRRGKGESVTPYHAHLRRETR